MIKFRLKDHISHNLQMFFFKCIPTEDGNPQINCQSLLPPRLDHGNGEVWAVGCCMKYQEDEEYISILIVKKDP